MSLNQDEMAVTKCENENSEEYSELHPLDFVSVAGSWKVRIKEEPQELKKVKNEEENEGGESCPNQETKIVPQRAIKDEVKNGNANSNTADSEDETSEENKCRPVRKKIMHLRPVGEERKFKCTHCGSAFKDISGLKKHVERHTTQKSHQCPLCSKKFYAPFDVKIHMRVHTKERPFLCTICGKTFLSNVQLKDHTRRHTNQRDYKCSICEKSFYNASLLAGHMDGHSNERRHVCEVCKASFAYRKGMRNHMKIHENKRAYKCELCSASFNQQAGLFCHMKNKHQS